MRLHASIDRRRASRLEIEHQEVDRLQAIIKQIAGATVIDDREHASHVYDLFQFWKEFFQTCEFCTPMNGIIEQIVIE
jgi:hypothetical protein